MPESITHLLLRIPVIADSIETIVEKHNDVALSFGSVWFGVRGQAPTSARLMSLTEQLERSIPTFFYLVQRTQPLSVFKSSILAIVKSLPEKESRLVPPYYAAMPTGYKAALWLKVGLFDEASNGVLDLLRVHTTGNPVTHALKGWSSFLIVSEGVGLLSTLNRSAVSQC